ncbi:hypothetical protein LCGC14_3063390 [marine sediment metagenome]|uniref:THIF-type NAD/FAD binding fold domain-containing protein n=1 Tax=marine sediment metagenome TaxID=412755 RepID=A0A0F8WI57_9ZZZZ
MEINKYYRQEGIVDLDSLNEHNYTVIGVGAVGRQVALQLTAMGVHRLQLVDFDTVDETNLATQAYYYGDIDAEKVEATGAVCQKINPEIELTLQCEAFTRRSKSGDIAFMCPDKIKVREDIFNAFRPAEVLIDARVAGWMCRILTIHDELTRDYYETTLFKAKEAHQARCTEQMTIFIANVAAALMLSQLVKYLRELPIEKDYICNLLSNEMTIMEEEANG